MGYRAPIIICLRQNYEIVKKWLEDYLMSCPGQLNILGVWFSRSYCYIKLETNPDLCNSIYADNILKDKPVNIPFRVYSEKRLYTLKSNPTYEYENREVPTKSYAREFPTAVNHLGVRLFWSVK